ncbi:hypothetical protein [Bacillus vallismortis]|uniref:hypothetical protein n=1 Tax=Bacillus vallismortis TaxID=72361 RepID=UPI000EF51E1A|nr:hypothetical protein [Bacillus vallismortis]MCY8424646.1 hypothetical protein [Bacillus vallismortis]
MDTVDFYRKLQQTEDLKKLVGTSLKTHCQNLKEDTKNASDFSSAQQVIAEVYVALLSSFEGKAKEALVQRLNENAAMLTTATENRSAFLRSIKTK